MYVQFWLSLCGVAGSWCTQGLFEPSEHLWQARGLTLNMILPYLPSCWGFFFARGHGVSFFGGIQHSPVNGCSAANYRFGVLAGEDERMSFYSAILCHKFTTNSKYVNKNFLKVHNDIISRIPGNSDSSFPDLRNINLETL